MSLKRISCLCVVLLLLAGMAGVADAATPQGVRLRIEHPATDTWAGIGDSVVVSVEYLPGTAALDSVWVAIVEDTTATNTTTLNASLTNNGGAFVKGFGTTDASSADSDGFKSFTATFQVTAGQTVESSSKSLSLSALVSTDTGATFTPLTNQNSDETISGVTSFGTVGDAVKIGIDAQRPAASITSVKLDTTGVSNFPNDAGGYLGDGNNASGDPKKAFKVGAKAKVTFVVTNVPSGASGIVHLVDTANVTSAADSAMKTINFEFSDLVSGSAVDSTTLGAGDVTGDNRRIVAVSFLTDAAGNLSSTNATDVTPVGVTDVNMHVLDVNAPTITPLTPKSGATDSTYFTGVVDTALTIVSLTGGTTSVTYAASPLKFTVSEGAKAADVKFADSTLVLSAASTTLTSSSLTASFATDFGVSTQAGSTDDLTISVTDSVGNETESSQAAVTYDQVAPGVSSIFPTRSEAPPDFDNSDEPTVNKATMMPIIKLLEATDSLAAVYVEVTTGTEKTAKQELAPGDPLLATTDTEITITFADSLSSNREYTLQLLFRDLAGNHQATAPDTLTFDADFQNPVADSFVVAASSSENVVIAGEALILDITGIDTALTRASSSNRAAVTHGSAAVLRIDAGDQDISTVTIAGTGVTDNGDGTAALSADDWTLGVRSVKITSTKTLAAFSTYVEDVTGDVVNYGGNADSLQVDAGNFASYNVTVVEDADGGDSAAGVSGEFQVAVQPADRWGNPSAKTWGATASPARSDSTALIDKDVSGTVVLGEVYVTISSNNGAIGVPQGPQAVNSAGSVFTVGGASEAGTGLLISVRSVGASKDSIGSAANAALDDDLATGSTVALTFAPEGVAVVVPGALAAPASLTVADWLGADGAGDQGGFVAVTFPAATGADRYRIFREVAWAGSDDAVMVSWTVLDNVAGDSLQRAVVPTLDNVSTNWAVASESGGSSSERAASKRVFTKQIVQNMVKFLGVDPNRVLSMTELEQVFTPSDDYVKSILGDRKGFRFAAIDPDVATLVGGTSTVPQNIRTQAGGVKTSARTATESPVAALDNIAPAAITGLANSVDGSSVTLSWTASVDDRVVAYSSYKGYAVPIAGVDRYEVYRGETEDALEQVGSVAGGVTTFTDDIGSLSNVIYRVDAADLDNNTAAPTLSVSIAARASWLNADGNPIFIVDEADGSPTVVDFGDFIAFAGSYNVSTGEPGFVANADTDDSGLVDFTDFLGFAASFNQVAVSRNGVPIASTKPLPHTLQPGVNDNVELSLNLTSEKVLVGQTVTLNVTVDNAASLKGFGFGLSYDTDKFEFVEAAPAQEDLLKSGGADTPVFLKHEETPGELTIANAIVDGSPVTGAGDVVSLTFRVLTEFEDNARFDIANGVVFDGSQLSNLVVALGSLNVESTPTEFALLQNFPNPFNPETTIKYNVASGSNVSLRIYNVVGQVVRTLVAEQQNAGRYTVRWNGADDRGVSVSSGIYFYQISAGNFSDVKKLMLLK